MLFNSYLFDNLKLSNIFDAPDWYLLVHIVIFFPSVELFFVRTWPPLTNDSLMTLCATIIINGFLYGIAFVFIKKISHLFRQLMEGEI